MTCQECGEEVDEVFRMKVKGKMRKLCEECVEVIQEEQEIASEAQGMMRNLMEYKG
jgi:hypothetical protein